MGRKIVINTALTFNIRVSALASRLLILLLAALISITSYTYWEDQFSTLESDLGNLGWTLASDTTPEERFTIIAIDEKSIAQLGPWPWPRATLAKLNQKLHQNDVSLQMYDIVFPEKKTNDQLLIKALRNTPSVIAQVPDLQRIQPLQSGVMSNSLEGMRCQNPLPSTDNYLANNRAFSGISAGHITPILNSNGSIHKIPPLICVSGQVYPSLTLSGVIKALQLQKSSPIIQPANHWLAPHWQLSFSDYPELKIPLDAQGNVRISYRKSPQSYQVIPAVDIINGQFDAQQLSNTWTLTGATAFGLGDVVPTPYSGATPGVELQARLLTSLLDNQFPYTPKLAPYFLLLISVLFAIILLSLANNHSRFKVIARPLAVVLLPLSALILHLTLLQYNLWLGWVAPALFALVASSLLTLLEHTRARVERARIYTNLSSYLPANVVQDVAFNLPSGRVEAQRKTLTLFNADLRNFSAFQEAMPAGQAATLLHCFFVQACQIIEQHGGSVHEFKGDAVLATWPKNAVANALQAAQELQKSSDQFLPQQLPNDLSPLALGIGIEQGDTLVGSIGPAHRRTHTLLGQTVTSVLRIQEMTSDLAQPILLGHTAAEQLGTKSLESQGDFLLDGLKKPHTLYAPLKTDIIAAKTQPKLTVLRGAMAS